MCCWCSEWFQTSGGATRKDLGQLLIGLESNLAVVTANGAKCFMGSRTNHTWKRWRTQLLLVHYMCVCVRTPVTVWLCMYRCTRVHSICARTCARAYFSLHICMRVCVCVCIKYSPEWNWNVLNSMHSSVPLSVLAPMCPKFILLITWFNFFLWIQHVCGSCRRDASLQFYVEFDVRHCGYCVSYMSVIWNVYFSVIIVESSYCSWNEIHWN